MKNKILFVSTLFLLGAKLSYGQVWGGGPGTTQYAWRLGNTSIGMNNGAWSTLHVYSATDNNHLLVSGNAPSLRFNNGTPSNGDLGENRADIGLATSNTHFVAAAIPNDLIIRTNTGTGNLLLGTGGTERLRIGSNGHVGIGTAFTSTSQPSRLLHLNSATPFLFLDGPFSGGSAMTPKVEFGSNGTPAYTVMYNLFAYCRGGHFKIGPTDGTKKAMHFINEASGKVIFSHNYLFGYGACGGPTPSPGLAGTYLFDDQVSSTSLLVAAATTVVPYPSIPSGYLFSVHGNANMNGRVQVNNSTGTVPDNSVQGLNISNTSTYAWVQTETLKPLALNPIPDGNPTNTSYVAIGFIPGTYTVPLHYKLAVKGKIICEELKVKYAGQWSDYVFAKEYKLRGLPEVEQFITENKHLPDVPSEMEIKENGFETGQMDATLLRKIEELTLYMIEMNKQIEALKTSNEMLKKDNQELKNTIK